MTADEQAQVENLTHKVEVLERELGEAHHALAVIRERIESLAVIEQQHFREKIEVLERELGEAHHALTVIEQQHFREKIEALEKAGDALANDIVYQDGQNPRLHAWIALRSTPVLSDPDTTPVPK